MKNFTTLSVFTICLLTLSFLAAKWSITSSPETVDRLEVYEQTTASPILIQSGLKQAETLNPLSPAKIESTGKQFGKAGSAKLTVVFLPGKGLKIHLRTPGFSAEPVDGVKGYRVQVDGQEHANPGGTPDLPIFVKVLPGHKGLKAVVDVEDVAYQDYEDFEVAPSPSFELDPDRLPDEMIPIEKAGGG